jgi:hypothetical protein
MDSPLTNKMELKLDKSKFDAAVSELNTYSKEEAQFEAAFAKAGIE